MNLHSQWKGLVDYQAMYDDQLLAMNRSLENGGDTVFGLEHPNVATLGRQIVAQKTIAEGEEVTAGFPAVFTDRGGQITLHSPGQLVIYPIVNLKARNLTLKEFIQILVDTTEEAFQQLDLKVQWKEECPGFYTEKGKIGFMGLRVKNGITLHGLSLNLNNDISVFKSIVSCGQANGDFDRALDYGSGEKLDLESFYSKWLSIFTHNLDPI